LLWVHALGLSRRDVEVRSIELEWIVKEIAVFCAQLSLLRFCSALIPVISSLSVLRDIKP